jgi:hypothetical protein
MKRPTPTLDRITLRRAYAAASADALRLYVRGHPTDEWRAACAAAGEAWGRMQEAA